MAGAGAGAGSCLLSMSGVAAGTKGVDIMVTAGTVEVAVAIAKTVDKVLVVLSRN